MKNRIEIEFNHGIFKAFLDIHCPEKKMIACKYYRRLMFVANTREQAEQRAKDFIESHLGIEGYASL